MVLAEPKFISWIGKAEQICRMITHTIESLRIFLGVNLASPILKSERNILSVPIHPDMAN
jgi:hypothetical protein